MSTAPTHLVRRFGLVICLSGIIWSFAPRVATAQPPWGESWGQAVRFLQQSSFGPMPHLVFETWYIGIETSLEEQFGKALTPYPDIPLRAPNIDSCDTNPEPAPDRDICRRDFYTMYLLQNHFFANALYGADQLRQRVAWAFSQIYVTSGLPPYNYAFWMRPYQQLLYEHAFGSFRQLLRDVTLSPMMGRYLDMVDNRCQLRTPSDLNVCRNGRVVKPNENYARELLQLFSIGTVLLNQDGTPVVDDAGDPVPSYDQETVEEFSRALTGWILAQQVAPGVPNYIDPMRVRVDAQGREDYHDKGPKTLLNGLQLPGGQSAEEELNAVLDNIMDHPNVAPFISKQLIQKLVTSNPSPAYVSRIADVFNANRDSGTQLQEVVRAILLDPEARGDVSDPIYGHLLEPVLAMTRVLRAFYASSDGVLASVNLGGASAYQIGAAQMEQDVFRPPSVFNYYSPDYQVPLEPGVLGPEFEIYSSMTAFRRANFFSRLIFLGIPPSSGDRLFGTSIDLGPYAERATDPATLVHWLNTLLLHDSMSPGMFEIITNYVASIPEDQLLRRAQHAVYLVVTSAQFQVER
jgi:uncharacterized protein (DUF1800 family)